MQESLAELLARLRPVLQEIFDAYQISEEQANRFLEEAGALLLLKRWNREHLRRWLVRTLIERCREAAMESLEDGDDPPSG